LNTSGLGHHALDGATLRRKSASDFDGGVLAARPNGAMVCANRFAPPSAKSSRSTEV